MKALKKIICAAAFPAALIISCCPAFAGETDTSVYYKNSSAVQELNGRIEFNKDTDITVEDETAASITTKKVNINTQKISAGEGEVVISNNTDTEYKDVKSGVIVDLEVDINSPVIYGDADVAIENSSETSFENTEAAYIYKYGYIYNNVISLPYFDSGGQVIIKTGKE